MFREQLDAFCEALCPSEQNRIFLRRVLIRSPLTLTHVQLNSGTMNATNREAKVYRCSVVMVGCDEIESELGVEWLAAYI